ncbi:hypothetical protein [Bacillus cereus]|uniref:hypothetical protein n=1 Tax=Bacillus cereus TaxID=1396 RepID=UPI001596A979|nr:hypothetical protein [Bacillus cereus]
MRLHTNEGVWFHPTDLTQQAKGFVLGYINPPDYTTAIQPGAAWNSLGLITGKSVHFYPVSQSGTLWRGWIYTPDYLSAMCPPFPTLLALNGTCWNSRGGKLYFTQTGYNVSGTYDYKDAQGRTIKGRIVGGALWGNTLGGQWIDEGGGNGRILFTFQANSFTGSYGSGLAFGGNAWNGTRC